MTQMIKEQILAKLQTVFDDVFVEPVSVKETLTAGDVQEWDSIIHLALIVAVEKAFGIRFRVGEVESARNVGELANIIMQRLAD